MSKQLLKLPAKVNSFYDHFARKICHNEVSAESHLMHVRAMLMLWTSTTTVMWLYVLYCFSAWGAYPVTWGGIVFSLIHSTVPLVFYYTQSFAISGIVLSLSGLCFQTLFCIYTGGVYSPAAIWLTFHPVILGFFGSTFLIVLQVILNLVIVLALNVAGQMHLLPPDVLPHAFRDWMIISCYVGLDVLIASFTVAAIRMNKEKNNELDRARELTENLLRILCHDINNPLLIIKNSSKYLDLEMLAKSPQHAERIKRACGEIEDLTRSIGEWMAYRDGKMNLTPTNISVKEILDHIHFSFEDKLNEKNIALITHVPSEDLYVTGDRTAVCYQLFSNIISNAIKFSFENSEIVLRFKDDGKFIVAQISDSGVGIKPEMVDKVFSPYDRTTSKGTRNERGTGFGLPIVAAVIEKMNGKISIANRSTLNASEQGTTVTVVLPKSIN